MSSDTYKVTYNGSILNGFSVEQVERSLQAQFQISEKGLTKFRSGKPFVIKGGLQEKSAHNLHAQLNSLGMDVSLEKEQSDFSIQEDTAPSDDLSVKSEAPLSLEGKFCPDCGASLVKTAVVCRKCGSKLERGERKSRAVAALLAFFFGGWGIHRVYLGQLWGLAYIPFSFFAISTLVAWVEAIVFVCTPKEKWDAKYGEVKSSGATLAIVIVVGLFGGTAIVGILAAIALPAYQDYTVRARTVGALVEAAPYQVTVAEFVERTNFVPNQNIDAGLPKKISSENLDSLEIGQGGQIILTIKGASEGNNTLVLVPDIRGDDISWECHHGTLPNHQRPPDCRQ